MDILRWVIWAALAWTVWRAVRIGPVIRRLRASDPETRRKARLELLDVGGSLVVLGGLVLSDVFATAWIWVTFLGAAVMAVIFAVWGIRGLRARSRSRA
ncbi:hypothetical protein ACN2WE_00290 [Streptomyces sp. cg28]|uniref:hypothetical protein n=1 Tax=Streptomyces sp. cg28 TaxID=3403457 RepID=UPI003B223671